MSKEMSFGIVYEKLVLKRRDKPQTIKIKINL